MPRRLPSWVPLLLAACASHSPVPSAQQAMLADELCGSLRYLRIAFFLTPFYGEGETRLLLQAPPEEVDFVARPDASPLPPGPALRILAPGRRARILKVEFPTGLAWARRSALTPRGYPWLFLEIEGEPKDHPIVLVLPAELRTHDELLDEVDRLLSPNDPAPLLSRLDDPTRRAIAERRALTGMESFALEMAWGYPLSRRITFDRGVHTEEWDFGHGRRARLAGGRLVEMESAAAAGP